MVIMINDSVKLFYGMGNSLKIAYLLFFCVVLTVSCDRVDNQDKASCSIIEDGIIHLAGGTYLKGSNLYYPEEQPVTQTFVKPFDVDSHEVTNRQFARFVDATGYISVAERSPDPKLHPDIPIDKLIPGAAVFLIDLTKATGGHWDFIEGAFWRAPEGAGSTIDERMEHPVTQIAYEDALAYAHWIGGDLPTEAEWEFAARGGLDNARYEWGDVAPDQLPKSPANSWQGVFPVINTGEDGFLRTAPVGCFDSNGYGLYDMTGNVWEWVRSANLQNNAGLIKGGSYLCAENYCQRYRPAARQSQELDFSTNHIGFRVVYRNDNTLKNPSKNYK